MLLLNPVLVTVKEVVAREDVLEDAEDPLMEALGDTDEPITLAESEVDDVHDVEEYPSAESLKAE